METEIGNRGSKSIIGMPIHTFVIIVNEQRVDGSWWEKYKNKCISHLRCTLLGLEINFKVSFFPVGGPKSRKALRDGEPIGLIPIPLFKYGNETEKIKTYIEIKRFYSSKFHQSYIEKHNLCTPLHPWFITGFSDAEGCISVSIFEDHNYKAGFRVIPSWSITLHVQDRKQLERIKKVFAVGRIFQHGPQTILFKVTSLKELEAVINHFEKYPLLTKKCADYQLFKRIFILIKNKEHITPEGLRQIVGIRAAMNWGLSDKLKLSFPDVVPVVRPHVELPLTIETNWLAGFTSGEGSYMIKITKSQTHSVGSQVILLFVITQHQRDQQQLLIRIKKYLGCGNLYKKRQAFNYEVTKFSDIFNKIIPFFKKYQIHGVKSMDFADFCEVAEMMNKREHLSAGGLEKIKQIKARMNLGRKLNF